MPSYTFETLSPLDFEYLVRDLLQKKLDCHIESFKSGKDGGVDLRVAKIDSRNWIVQCKRYVESSFSDLKRAVKKEVPKVNALDPERYFLCTALKLLPQQKDELLEILAPHLLSTEDILGNECLNNLLGQYQDVERQHFKLWLCSEGILQRVLKSQIFNRTALTAEDIKHRISMFVPTPAVSRAREILRNKGYCLIAGIPGIGKTTTAEMLLAMHVEEDWEPVCVTNAAQAIEALQSSAKQIVYYDDFLGQTSLDEKLAKNEEDDILRLVKHCQRRPKSKRFILTTREYLLEQANHVHAKLKRSKLDVAQCTIKLEEYTKRIRAKILLNHLFFFGVSKPVRVYMADKRIARAIVDHPNYNPRVIEEMCDDFGRNEKTPAAFSKAFLQFLDNPSEIWSTAYESHLSNDAKELLICFASIGGFTSQESLKDAFLGFSAAGKDSLNFDYRFGRALKELDGNFLRSLHGMHSGSLLFQFQNPSVKDFTDSIIRQKSIAIEVVRRSVFHAQLVQANSWKSVDEAEAATAILRTIDSVDPTFKVKYGFTSSAIYFTRNKFSLARRIVFWAVQCDECPKLKQVLLPKLAELGERLLISEALENEGTEALVRLFQFVVKQQGGKFKYSIRKIHSLIVSSISTSEEFLDLEDFLNDLDDNERKELDFDIEFSVSDFADHQLLQATMDSDSASELSETIEEVRDTMAHFNLSEEELTNWDDADIKLAILSEQDEYEAERDEDDYLEGRHVQRSSEADIDDILDSLRE